MVQTVSSYRRIRVIFPHLSSLNFPYVHSFVVLFNSFSVSRTTVLSNNVIPFLIADVQGMF